MDTNDYILRLVNEALEATDRDETPLSVVIRKCIRIARLRNDYPNLWWLEWEMMEIVDAEQRERVLDEVKPHLTQEEFRTLHKELTEAWLSERKHVRVDRELRIQYDDDTILAKSIGEIEIDVARNIKLAQESFPPQGMHPVDLYFTDQAKTQIRAVSQAVADSAKSILERVRQRVHDFLSHTEKQLIFGQLHSDIFERNRQFVDLKLGQLCPDAISKFVAAYQRLRENTPESRAQALTSCRRLLKSIADVLYPATDKPVVGVDGKPRVLSDEKYISRLWQYIYEQTSRSASGEMLWAQTQDLGSKIDRLYDLANKGVHAEVSEFEVNQCVIQTYLLAGDLLRIAESKSAIQT